MQTKKGFTLLELLIVISIIGILVTVVAASYTSSQQKARNSRRMQDMKALQNAFEQYYADNSATYPTGLPGAAYLPVAPTEPKPAPYPAYNYSYPSPGSSYCVCARLEPNPGATGGNSSTNTCNFSGSPKSFFCVANLQ